MNKVAHHLRKKIIERLTGNVLVDNSAIDIVNRVQSSVEEPFVKVSTISVSEIDQNLTNYNVQTQIRFEVVTKFDGDDGGELVANKIVDQILNQIRTRSSGYVDLSSENFKVYTTELGGTNYSQVYSKDKTYFRAAIDINFRIEIL